VTKPDGNNRPRLFNGWRIGVREVLTALALIVSTIAILYTSFREDTQIVKQDAELMGRVVSTLEGVTEHMAQHEDLSMHDGASSSLTELRVELAALRREFDRHEGDTQKHEDARTKQDRIDEAWKRQERLYILRLEQLEQRIDALESDYLQHKARSSYDSLDRGP
jgi:uncharacterized small protein (DUF1192 family)